MKFDLGIDQIVRCLSANLLVVTPIYNEETNIRTVINEWMPALEATGAPFTILALNDGSRDGTANALEELESSFPDKLCVINKRNSGHGLTCRMGYDISICAAAEWVLQIDSDGQCDPQYFKEFWSLREEADCVFGKRISRGDGKGRAVTSWICSKGSSLICGHNMGDANVPYRLIRRSVLEKALPHVPRDFNIHNVALTYVLKRMDGIRWQYVPIHFRDRQGGTNSIDILKVSKWGFEMLFELMTIRKPK